MANIQNDEDRYVVPQHERWAVEKEHAQRASAVFDTQEEAIARAKEIVERSGRGRGDVRIMGEDGRWRDAISGSRNDSDAPDRH